MRKFFIIILFLSSLLLVGCDGIKSEVIGGANTSHKKIEIGKFMTDEFLDEIRIPPPIVTVKQLKEHGAITVSEQYAFHHTDKAVYSFCADKYFPIDDSSEYTLSQDKHYLLVEYADKYVVFNYMNAEILYTFPKEASVVYQFGADTIIVSDIVDGEPVERIRYYFDWYEPIEEEEDFDPLEVQGLTIDDYTYRWTEEAVTVYKENQFYFRYFYESDFIEGLFFLENGNILIQYLVPLPADAMEYDIFMEGEKVKQITHLVNLAKKEIKVVKLPIIIEWLQRRGEFFPIGVESLMMFRTIDPVSKMINEKIRTGSLSNKLEIRELTFEFGEFDDIYAFNKELFLVTSEAAGAFLINGKNDIINSLYYDSNRFKLMPFDNVTGLLYDKTEEAGEVYIYDLVTGSLTHEGFEFIKRIDERNVILSKNDLFYIYDGELRSLEGEPQLIYGRPFYVIEVDGEFKYYYADGTLVLTHTNGTLVPIITCYYDDVVTFVFEYIKDTKVEQTVVRVKQRLVPM